MTRYYTLLVHEYGQWAYAFGAYTRADVESERADQRDHGVKARDLMIIISGDTQAEIDDAIAMLNGKG